MSVQWDPPTDNGGRDDLTYTVTISPPAQLSATVVTSTSVTVSANYSVNYTVSVVATNCAGNSGAGENSFRVGEKITLYPLLIIANILQESVLSSLISLVMVPLDQSLAEYKVQQ